MSTSTLCTWLSEVWITFINQVNDVKKYQTEPFELLKFTHCFEIQKSVQNSPFQLHWNFTHPPNRSEDTVSHILHVTRTHTDNNKRNYVRLLFLDYSSKFNAVIPPPTSWQAQWPQWLCLGLPLSNINPLSTGAPQGCVLSPLLNTCLIFDTIRQMLP